MGIQSIVQKRGSVAFPQFIGERVYMREFRKSMGLPSDLKDRWQHTVDAMLDGVDTDGPIYIMIDQGLVKAGTTQRRPGLHIDGYWHPAISAHGGVSHHGSQPVAPKKDRRERKPSEGGHGGVPSRHAGSPMASEGEWDRSYEPWKTCELSVPEGLILASNISACRAVIGEYHEIPREGGDCSHVDVSGMDEVIMLPNTVYAGNVGMLHESMPVAKDVQRTLVRLSVPGWTPVIQ